MPSIEPKNQHRSAGDDDSRLLAQVGISQSCPTLHDPMDCSPPGSSIHGLLQARVLEWDAIAFSASHLTHNQLHPLILHNSHF